VSSNSFDKYRFAALLGPLAFVAAMKKGRKVDDFLIDKSAKRKRRT
jgi:hypothetical protein